jgi:hypothetical protein
MADAKPRVDRLEQGALCSAASCVESGRFVDTPINEARLRPTGKERTNPMIKDEGIAALPHSLQ